MKPSWTRSEMGGWDAWFFWGGLQREGVCQAPLLLCILQETSMIMNLAVCSPKAAEARVGVVNRQNETLGKNMIGMEEGREKKAKLQFASHGGQGHRAY